jgi:hypothetical protein
MSSKFLFDEKNNKKKKNKKKCLGGSLHYDAMVALHFQ